jgi:sterol 3beta-glucosyltransferase
MTVPLTNDSTTNTPGTTMATPQSTKAASAADTTADKPRPGLIWMLATGTRGDIQPFTAVGMALQRKKGCRVRFFTNRDYVPFVNSFGLQGIALRGSNREVGHADDPSRPLQSLIETNTKTAAESAKIIRDELDNEKPDLVIASAMLTGIAWYLTVRHNIPHLDMTPVADIELPKLPFNWQTRLLARQVYHIFRPFLRELDPGLERRIPPSTYHALLRSPDRPILVMQSPTIAKIQYAHLTSPMYRYVGTTVIEASEQTQPSKKTSGTEDDDDDEAASFGGVGGDAASGAMRRLQDFLDHPQKPIYMGWGSMKSRSPEHLVELCVRALRESGQRAIVLEGEAGLSQQALEGALHSARDDNDRRDLLQYANKHVLFVRSAPHEWLFPKVAAIVHHGGAGTTTASFRSGVPSVVAPVLADQFDHSRLVNRLGVGIGLSKQINALRWQELSEAIRRAVTDAGMKSKAAELSNQLLSERNGADVAVEEVEAFWSEYWLSGMFRERFPPPTRASPMRSLMTPIGGAFLVAVAVVAILSAIFARSVVAS